MKEKLWQHTGNTTWEDDILYGGELFDEAFRRYTDRLEHKEFAQKKWEDQRTGS